MVVDSHVNLNKVTDITHITNSWSKYRIYGNIPWFRFPTQAMNPKRASVFTIQASER